MLVLFVWCFSDSSLGITVLLLAATPMGKEGDQMIETPPKVAGGMGQPGAAGDVGMYHDGRVSAKISAPGPSYDPLLIHNYALNRCSMYVTITALGLYGSIAGIMRFSSPSSSEQASPLLHLPVELRRHIYHYVLPSTSTFDVRLQRKDYDRPQRSEYNLTFVRENLGSGVWKMQKTLPKTDRETGNDIVWRRGSIGILATSHQIHDECVDMIYGENIFVIDVAFDCIRFRYRWFLPSNLTPSRTYSFLDHFSQRNLMRIKNYIINVEHVDDYAGMIKFNCGGRGLTARIRQQVQRLVDLLCMVPYLHRLQIHLIDGAISGNRFPSGRVHRVHDEKNYSQSQTVLDPFHRIYGVRKVQVTGVSVEYAEALERSVTASRGIAG
ncbi:uncharacterized protein BDR25DRAFT_351748 [Lindgomyces ingoldianus]|uniref:Uncharacterized protein n=1 Tax=Lindgomyces ingoldianus TaxID=673940 RepID=A0ACB6R4Z5_9PLEO|nr:uncharacterized protein BDR25DRAFT_351748 [Lindgomyces ingoldianus]KAF2474221.1 hypothetical protein BDR25DRAFT_351748 [Lindgomyces ingoldianus]